MYNLFMDEFTERVNEVSAEEADMSAVFFADDVLLAAKSPPGLQRLLNIATK